MSVSCPVWVVMEQSQRKVYFVKQKAYRLVLVDPFHSIKLNYQKAKKFVVVKDLVIQIENFESDKNTKFFFKALEKNW